MAPSELAASSAARAAMAFWRALGNDDEEALAPLLSSAWGDRPDDFRDAYLAARDLTPQTCLVMGVSTYVEVLSDDRLRLWFSPVEHAEYFEAGEPTAGWRLELVREGAEWLVDRSSETEPVASIDLSAFLGQGDPPASSRAH